MQTHRDIAEQLDLFHSEPDGPGMIFWHPNGWRLYQGVQEHMRRLYRQHGFQEVNTPLFLKKSLWETSGHLAMFADNMFFGGDKESPDDYALKPMSCPAHILLFKRGIHSYRDLPLRWFEFGVVHRNESSGALNGCLRLRQFTQDDAHVFCSWEQAFDEVRAFLRRARQVYGDYGHHQLEIKLSTQPEAALGQVADWQRAEAVLRAACAEEQWLPEEQPGEGAFYGPKLELALKDSVGRVWQCGTIQLDFNLPERFDIDYMQADGSSARPVILHQAMYGSLERWIGILLESSQGALPEWIHPIPVAIVQVSDAVSDYAQALKEELESADIPVLMDKEGQSIARKIKHLHRMHVPNILVIGEKEKSSECVALRRGKEQHSLPRSEFFALIKALRQGR